MKHFANPDRKPFKYLSDEEMLCIIKAKMEGNVEMHIEDYLYTSSCHSSIDFTIVYRTKQKSL